MEPSVRKSWIEACSGGRLEICGETETGLEGAVAEPDGLAGVLAKLEGKIGRENGRRWGFGRRERWFDRGLVGSC